MLPKKTTALILAFLILLPAAFYCGWLLKSREPARSVCKSSPLRLGGFSFTKPLLVCDTNTNKDRGFLPLKNKLDGLIAKEETAGNIDVASIYFQDFKTDGRIDLNPDEKFDPASLTKVAVMIAALKRSDLDPNFLSKEFAYSADTDFNSDQEIKPKEFAKPNQYYTVENLLKMMIEYSDNNSFRLLENLLGEEELKSFFSDIQVSFPANSGNLDESDSLTTKDVSYFFRILYNSTYLKDNLSDMALNILSQADFKNGIVAGVPENIKVAHKFGLETIFDFNGKARLRELSDCGIIYNPINPYLLCVMTKSSSDSTQIENTIKDISSTVWQFQNNN